MRIVRIVRMVPIRLCGNIHGLWIMALSSDPIMGTGLILRANIGEVHNQSSMIIYVWQMLPWIFLYAAIRTIRWALQTVSDHLHLRIVHIPLMTHYSSP